MFKMEFTTDGTAFGSGYDPDYIQNADKIREINRIVQKVTTEIASNNHYGSIMDVNGNKIGNWSLD